MKKLLNLLLFSMLSCHLMAQLVGDVPVSIRVTNEIEKELSILGLKAVSVEIINTSDTAAHITELERLFLRAKPQGEYEWIRFYEGHVLSGCNVHYMRLNSKDTLRLTVNLNFFDFATNYEYCTGQQLTLPTEVIFQICVNGGRYSGETYYSKEHSTKLYPLSETDYKAFEYIKANDYKPYNFTRWSRMTTFNIPVGLSDSVITKYPNSTFSELASLSNAYLYAKGAIRDPALKDKSEQYLKKPLSSGYSFICYLAEQLPNPDSKVFFKPHWILSPYVLRH